MGYSFGTKVYKKINGIPPDLYVYMSREECGGICYQAANITATGVRGWGSCEEKLYL